MPNAITLANVAIRAGAKALLEDVSVTVPKQGITVVAGPNGAGKSTLLSVLTGERTPHVGTVQVFGQPLRLHSRGDLARLRGVMPQDIRLDVPMRVSEVVALGRFPHRKTSTKRTDDILIAQALDRTDTVHLAGRLYDSLSGGERARVAVARLLVQQAPILLLDEPIASLDPKHQYLVLELLQAEAQAGAAVVIVMHDLHLAREYAQHAVLLKHGTVAAAGPANEVLTTAQLRTVFDTEFASGTLANGKNVIVPVPPVR